LIERAVRQGSEVGLSYAPTSGIVSVALVHRNGKSNELFAAQVSEGDEDEEFGPDGYESMVGRGKW
jgi:hypothetical protein